MCSVIVRYVATQGRNLKPLPTGAVDFAFITVILAFLVWAAAAPDKSEALTPDRTSVVD